MVKTNYKRTLVYPLIPAGAYILLSFLDQYPTVQSISADLTNFTYNLLATFAGIYLVGLGALLGLNKSVTFSFNT